MNFEMLFKNVLPGFYVTVSGLTHKRCLCVYVYVKEKKGQKPIYYFSISCYLWVWKLFFLYIESVEFLK